MKMFNEKADENIVQEDTDQYKNKIPEKLYTSVQNGTRKYHMTHQHKSGWKTYEKGYDKSRDMRLECDESQVKYLFMQNIIVSKEINENVEDRIGTSANSITKSLQGNELTEGRVEKIYNGNDLLFWHKSSDSGREVNINEGDSLPNKYYFCVQFNLKWSLYQA
jgi:hypothetical protein